MNKKDKIFVFLLLGILGFVFFRGYTYLKKTYLSAGANFQVASVLDEPRDPDTDGDGLSDIEESFYKTDFENPDTDGDGYLDGEELLSGHDPRVAAPGDIKPGALSNRAATINLTKRLSGRILASIYEKDISPTSIVEGIDGDLLDIMAFNTLSDSVSIFYTKPIDPSEINLFSSTNTEDEQEYLENLLSIMKQKIYSMFMTQLADFSLAEIGSLEDPFFKAGNSSLAIANSAKIELLSIYAPKAWEDIHISALQLFNDYMTAYEALKYSDNDGIKGLLAIQRILVLGEQTTFLLNEIYFHSQERGLVIPEEFTDIY